MFFIAIGIAKYANLLDFSCCAEPLKHTAGLHQLLHLIRIWGNGRFLVAPFYLHEPVFKIDREHLTFLNAIRITCDNGESNVRAAKKRKVEWSKVVCLLAMLAGLLIVQECLFLMYLCIKSGYTAAAAWLTAATGVGEAIIIAGANGYLSLAKSDHKRGGITFEAAKANNFRTDTEDDGSIDSPAI